MSGDPIAPAPKLFYRPTPSLPEVEIDFPDVPTLARIRRSNLAWRDITEGGVEKYEIRSTTDLIWLRAEDLSLSANLSFFEEMKTFEGHALSGRPFGLALEGDNSNVAETSASASPGDTSLFVTGDLTDPPFPEGRRLLVRLLSTTVSTAALYEEFIAVSVVNVGGFDWEIGLDKPLARLWPAGSIVHSRYAWMLGPGAIRIRECLLLDDAGIVRRKASDLFDVVMTIRTQGDFETP